MINRIRYQAAAILLDSWLRGRRKAVWISKSDKLIEDAQRDWAALGMERLLVTQLSRFPQGKPIALVEATRQRTATVPISRHGFHTACHAPHVPSRHRRRLDRR